MIGAPTKDETITFGKYAGSKMGAIFRTDPGYVTYSVSKVEQEGAYCLGMKRWAQFIVEEEGRQAAGEGTVNRKTSPQEYLSESDSPMRYRAEELG